MVHQRKIPFIFIHPVGAYTVTLTVFNISTGCDYTKTAQLTIADGARTLFTAVSGLCKNTSTYYFPTLNINPGYSCWLRLGFGNGTTGTNNVTQRIHLRDYMITYYHRRKPKTHWVKTNYIKVNGLAAFSVPGSCLNAILIAATTSQMEHTCTNGALEYGDGLKFLRNTPFQLYASLVFIRWLVVKDNYGCIDSVGRNNVLTISTPVANYLSFDTRALVSRSSFQNLSTEPSLILCMEFLEMATSTK
jgi:hypothetical protein